jgi:ABC-type bacteriocin/lantibiotic exporter with double-glycine peptidase domain
MIFSIITELIPSTITIVFTLIYSIYLNWRLATLIFVLIPLISFIINIFSKTIKNKSELTQFSLSDIYSFINENFFNFLIIKSNGYEKYKLDQYVNLQQKYQNNGIKVVNYISLQPSIVNIVQVTGISIIACFGAYQVFNDNMKLSDLIAFATTLSLTIEPAIFITKSLGIIEKSKVSVSNIKKTMSSLKKNKQTYGNKEFNDKFNIKFENITFIYSNNESNFSINNFNLEIKDGEILGIWGENGSGKSTIVKMLIRLIDNYQGLIKIGDIDIKKYSKSEINKIINISFHEPFLFNTSIRNNIIMNDLIDDKLIQDVCKITGINDFINTLKNGLDFYVGEKGDNLSSGQKQRISLARAIIKKPKILILDEATSNIDIESEKNIYKSIKEFLPNSTIIIINHRFDSIDFVDRTINLNFSSNKN